MKRFRLRVFLPGIVFFIILLYLELIFRILTKTDIFNISLLYLILFNLIMVFILKVVSSLGSKKVNRIVFLSLVFTLCLIYCIQLCVFKMFGFYFDWSLLGATSQVASFAGDGVKLVLSNIIGVILLLLPFIILLINKKCIAIEKNNWQKNIMYLGFSVLTYGLFIGALFINPDASNSFYKLYYNVNNIELNIKSFGVLNSLFIDTKRSVFGFSEKINIPNKRLEEDENPEIVYEYNNLDIDFDKLIQNEKNSTIKTMHEYFKNETGTKQNEYTNYFKGKNLILFMAESFNEIAVREDLTPTLYKLVHSGFDFENFYTPTISSTIGGEFQELTGLVAASGFLGPWKKGENYYPMGVANVFRDLGYATFAYHDHNYTFQNRNKYLKALGFTNYKGCRNGLEKEINCKTWPESDVEMIEATVDDFINLNEPFFTYYATVSGHGGYSWSASAMARKHKDEVSHLNYSEKPLAYLAAQIELDQALELLIQKLEEKGKLDDTVIALVGDHYPYYLSIDEVNEIASYKKDSVVEVNHSNFILWNNKMNTVKVKKVGSQIDVLPTLYNLFGVKYDSRLIIGKDILSTEPGLAIFGNSSWVSDKGTYLARSNKFILNNGEVIDEGYVSYMNDVVAGKIAMSKNIMVNNYYQKIWSD